MQKKILVVSPVECYPAFYGNSARIAAFMDYIRQSGFAFQYLHLPDRAFDPVPMVKAFGLNYIYNSYCPRKQVIRKLRFRALQALLLNAETRKVKVDDFVQRSDIKKFKKSMADFQPDVVFINYTYYSKLFNFVPIGIEKILDTHDSLHLRFQQLYNSPNKLQNFRIDVEDEIQALNRADKIISIQAKEGTFFREHGCSADIYNIGHDVSYRPTAVNGVRHKLLYIGADYSANVEGLYYFIEEIWPALKRRYTTIELWIAGGISKKFESTSVQDSSVKTIGYIEDLSTLYTQIDIAINPVRVGSGMKIKNIEALSFGKPIITTSVGGEGLEMFAGRGLEIADGVDDWVRMTGQLLHHDEYYNKRLQLLSEEIECYNQVNKKNLHSLFNGSNV